MQLIRKYSIVIWTAGMLAVTPGLHAKDKKKKTPARESQDAIEVIGNVPGLNGTVTGVRGTQHYSRYYLYVEYAGPGKVTLVDITNAAQPLVLGDLSPPSDNTA